MLAVPNFCTSRSEQVAALRDSMAAGGRLLDVHSDDVHWRSVFNLAGAPGELVAALDAGARTAKELIDMGEYSGAHPAIGALDVAPIVWLTEVEREAARGAALSVAGAIAALDIPVFLYGDLASAAERRERAFFRRGGLAALRGQMANGLAPDFGPERPHPTAGATLVTARPPLAAFNLVAAGIDLAAAEAVARRARETGGGPAGLRAIAIDLGDGRLQISTNVHDPINLRLATVTELVRDLVAERGGELLAAEIVGLVPREALAGFPDDLSIEGFDPDRQVIENRLDS